jgi:hypothetical protein
MTSDPDRLNKLRELKRQRTLLDLQNAIQDAIGTRRLSFADKTRFLGRIVKLTVSRTITPAESRKLTKAVMGAKDEI